VGSFEPRRARPQSWTRTHRASLAHSGLLLRKARVVDGEHNAGTGSAQSEKLSCSWCMSLPVRIQMAPRIQMARKLSASSRPAKPIRTSAESFGNKPLNERRTIELKGGPRRRGKEAETRGCPSDRLFRYSRANREAAHSIPASSKETRGRASGCRRAHALELPCRSYFGATTDKPGIPAKSLSRVTSFAPSARAVAATHRSFSSNMSPLCWRVSLRFA